jgi:hypothetical protein
MMSEVAAPGRSGLLKADWQWLGAVACGCDGCCQAEGGEPGEQPLQGDCCFQAGQRGAQAEVRPVPEGEA